METRQEQSVTVSEIDKKVEALNAAGLFDAKAVGPNTISAISIMGQHESLSGNVLRRLCKLGGVACQHACYLDEDIIETVKGEVAAKCADGNLVEAILELGTKPKNVFMVGVTADGVGFADEVSIKPEKYPYSVNGKTGIKELPGFNAFFAKEDDLIEGEPVTALGRRLADCGDINLDFVDQDGRSVMGFMHMTKPNLQGEGAQRYEYQAKKVGSFEYFLRSALEHYGADINTVSIRVAAAIRPEHYVWCFDSEEDMDKKGFVGWKDTLDEAGKPLLKNQSNPDWRQGQPFDQKDVWFADFPAMLRWQMAQVRELKPEQIDWEEAIDPGDKDSSHASNYRSKSNPDADGRDGYFTVWADKIAV